MDDNETNSTQPMTIRKRRLTSQVWQNFDLIKSDGKRRIAKCELCGIEHVAPGKNGTRNIRKRWDKCSMRGHQGISQLVFSQSTLSNPNFNFEKFKELCHYA